MTLQQHIDAIPLSISKTISMRKLTDGSYVYVAEDIWISDETPGYYTSKVNYDKFMHSGLCESLLVDNELGEPVYVICTPILTQTFMNMVDKLNTCECLDSIELYRRQVAELENRFNMYFSYNIQYLLDDFDKHKIESIQGDGDDCDDNYIAMQVGTDDFIRYYVYIGDPQYISKAYKAYVSLEIPADMTAGEVRDNIIDGLMEHVDATEVLEGGE
jgi:hypothetical protein